MISFVVVYRSVASHAQLVKQIEHVSRIVSVYAETTQQIALFLSNISKQS